MSLFKNNGHCIFDNDAIKVLRSDISDASVDLIFVDPPYNIGKKFSQFEDIWPSDAEYIRGLFCVFTAFFQGAIRMFQRENEMKNIVLSDSEVREKATRHFFWKGTPRSEGRD